MKVVEGVDKVEHIVYGEVKKVQAGQKTSENNEYGKVIYSRESGINFIMGADNIGYPGSSDLKATDTIPKEKSDLYPNPRN